MGELVSLPGDRARGCTLKIRRSWELSSPGPRGLLAGLRAAGTKALEGDSSLWVANAGKRSEA